MPKNFPKKAKRIPITAGKDIAHKYGYQQIVIIGRRHGDGGVEHVTTYGIDKANCDVAALMGNTFKRVMNWPEDKI